MTKFKQWMKESTIEEKRELAAKAETSLSLLYQLSYGTRKASADLAGRIEKACAGMKNLPVISKGDLCDACAKCSYYKECKSE